MSTEPHLDKDPLAVSADTDPLIGKVISERYRILERVGRGGFGAVYRVQHVRLDKTLALKVLFEHSSQNPRMIKRFEREARATCRIGHENIVEITDFARDRRVGYYFVMEFLDGESLQSRLKKLGPMSAARIVHIGSQMADALAATHAKGIVHRDLKPDNVFLIRRRDDDSFAKILDFGIAAMADLDEAVPRLTRHGTMLGTPAYMSPEQAEGKPPDHRSDIYSLGIMLYEMTTGQVPHRNAASMAVLEMHRSTEPVAPRMARPDLDIPPALERVILRALRKPVSQRYQTMSEVYNDLLALTSSLDMSEVAGRQGGAQVKVERSMRPANATVETEEPEWLDEELVLLDDDLAPGVTLPMTVEGVVVDSAEGDTGRTQPMSHPGTVDAVLDVSDVDIVETAPLSKAVGANAEPASRRIETAAASRPKGETGRPQRPSPERPASSRAAKTRPQRQATRPADKTQRTAAPERDPSEWAARTPPIQAALGGPAQGDEPRRSVWRRPPVLVTIGFLATLAVYGAFLWLTHQNVTEAPAPGEPEATAAQQPSTPPNEQPRHLQPIGHDATRRPAFGPPAASQAIVGSVEAPKPATRAPADLSAKPSRVRFVRARALATARPQNGLETDFAPPASARGELERSSRRPRQVLDLEPSVVYLEITTRPPGATVSYGGKSLGATPLSVRLPRGTTPARLALALKGYHKKTRTLTLNHDQSLSVMLKKRGTGGGGGRRRPSGGGNTYEIY